MVAWGGGCPKCEFCPPTHRTGWERRTYLPRMATDGTMRRNEFGYAVLLSVPVGVGVALAVYQTTGDFPGNPLAVGGGLLTVAAVFALVVLGVRPGPDAPEPEEGPTDGTGD